MLEGKTVWHVSSKRWTSAVTEYALRAAQAFHALAATSVLSPLLDSPGHIRARQLGIRSEPLSGFGVANLAAFREVFRVLNPDLVVVYGGAETILSKFLPSRVPVARFRGRAFSPDPVNRLRHNLAHSHCAVGLAPSAKLARELTRCTNLVYHPVFLGCDTTDFRHEDETINNELLMVGRLDPIKGHKAWFQLMKLVYEKWPQTSKPPTMHVVGSPASVSADEIRRWAGECGIGDRLVLTDRRVENIAALMRTALIGVIPSLGSEIIGRVAEEFLLCGTPVIVSGVGSLRELLIPGSGFSYHGLSQHEAASAIIRFIIDTQEAPREKRKQLSQRANEKFSLEAMARGLAKVLGHSLLGS